LIRGIKKVFAIALTFVTIACGKTADPDAPIALECKGAAKAQGTTIKPEQKRETRTYLVDTKSNQVLRETNGQFNSFCRERCKTAIDARSISVAANYGPSPIVAISFVIDRVKGAIEDRSSMDFRDGNVLVDTFSGSCEPIDIPNSIKTKF
jgi:hypothetical protein